MVSHFLMYYIFSSKFYYSVYIRLHGGTNLEGLEATLLKKKVDLIRNKLELLRVESELEQVNTEAVYESQMLKILAVCTKPLKKVEKKILQICRENI